jgi:hypothetical protein
MDEKSAADILRVLGNVSEAFRGTMTDAERAALEAKHAMTEFTADALQ